MHDLGVLAEDPNQIIINKYLKGQSIGAHTDNEKYFGKDVASLSLGSEVKMTFRPIAGKAEGKLIKIPLKVGSLLTFGNDARYKWTHSIEKSDTRHIVKPRISITFRHVKMEYQGNYLDIDSTMNENETITITFGNADKYTHAPPRAKLKKNEKKAV